MIRFAHWTEHFWSGKEWFMEVDLIISILGNVISFMICETIVQIIKRKKR